MNKEREKMLLRYTAALLTGDWDEQERILASIEGQPELQEAILSVHNDLGNCFSAEATELSLRESRQAISDLQGLLSSHFEGRLLDHPENASAFDFQEEDIPKVTVAEVANRLKSEVIGREREQAETALTHLASQDSPLPESLSPRQIRTLLHQMGIDLGRWFEQRFHEAAFHLESGRQNQRLIAARRVRERRQLTQNLKKEEDNK